MNGEPTDSERIEAALICATEVGMSPAMTLSTVMAALGFDFGEPEQIEHDVMQFYADTDNNPFVQAQIEARLLLDAGHLERLAQAVKRRVFDRQSAIELRQQLELLDKSLLEEISVHHRDDKMLIENIATVWVRIIGLAISRFGVNRFNDAIGVAVDDLIKEISNEVAKLDS